MTHAFDEFQSSLGEVRLAREQAEIMRDQLLAEYQRIRDEEVNLPENQRNAPQRCLGREAMRKAIAAANRAIASIDQALREMERVTDDDPADA